MYPESYIQKSSGVWPGLLSWMAKQCCNINRHRCDVPGDLVPMWMAVLVPIQCVNVFVWNSCVEWMIHDVRDQIKSDYSLKSIAAFVHVLNDNDNEIDFAYVQFCLYVRWGACANARAHVCVCDYVCLRCICAPTTADSTHSAWIDGFGWTGTFSTRLSRIVRLSHDEQRTAPPMIIATTTAAARYISFVDRFDTHTARASAYFGGYSAVMSVCDMCECFHAGFIVITK